MPAIARRHDIDALRVAVFALLILYHVGMLYVAEWGWHIKSGYQSEALQYAMLASNRWRMPILFFLSGVALSLLRPSLGPVALARSRTRRLLLPLAFGMLVVVPVQPYVEAVTRGAVAPGFWDFYVRYWSFQPWPADAFTGAHPVGITWNHLWYLAYLWVYTVVLVLLQPVLESRAGRRLRDGVTGLRGGWLLLLPAAIRPLWVTLLGDAYPPTHDLVQDWYQHGLFFSLFAFGYLAGTDDGFWAELRRLRHTTLRLALLAYAAYVAILEGVPDDGFAGGVLAGARAVVGLLMWMTIAAVLGWGSQLLNRPFRWLPWASEAVYPWYVLHQSLIVVLAYVLVPLELGPGAEVALVLAGTVAGCAVLTELVRRTWWLRPLFGLKILPAGAPPVQSAQHSTT